jgi:protein-S-isoprenylcysteine O-methyltransferase Ste14
MASPIPVAAAFDPVVNLERSWASRIGGFLSDQRVRISVILFALLVAEDVITGVNPHDPLNSRDPKAVVGVLLVFMGLAIRSWAAGVVRKNAELATSGPYGLVRHPLYFGSFLLMIGFCLLIDDYENIFFVLGPVLWIYLLRMRDEERFLAEKFPESWPKYVADVPKLIPRRLTSYVPATWDAGQWFRNREYQALAGALAGVLAIKLWDLS